MRNKKVLTFPDHSAFRFIVELDDKSDCIRILIEKININKILFLTWKSWSKEYVGYYLLMDIPEDDRRRSTMTECSFFGKVFSTNIIDFKNFFLEMECLKLLKEYKSQESKRLSNKQKLQSIF